MKYVVTLSLLILGTILTSCHTETSEEEDARLEQEERAQGYPPREGLRPRSTANF